MSGNLPDRDIMVSVDPYEVVDAIPSMDRWMLFVPYLEEMGEYEMEVMVKKMDAETIDKLLKALQTRQDILKL